MANQTGKGCFKPGQSGNPGGRPVVAREVKSLAMQHTAEAIEEPTPSWILIAIEPHREIRHQEVSATPE